MSNINQTIIEIVNHLAQKHPELAGPIAQIASKGLDNQSEIMRYGQVYQDWGMRQFGAPSPNHIKQQTVLRNGLKDAVWIETGTFLGDTTALMAATGNLVFTIEPEPNLYLRAVERFQGMSNVTVINELSEIAMPKLLSEKRGAVNFWLDGHYSGGITFKGPKDTPLADELREIAKSRTNMTDIVVMVDDIRCCDPRHSEYQEVYPSLDFLVDWARANYFSWRIEQDIFIART